MRNKRKFSASQPEQEGWRVFSTPHTHTHTHIYSYTHLSPCFADTHDVTQRKQRTPFGQVMVQDRKLRWSITDHLPTNPFQDKRIHCFTVPSSRLTHTHTIHFTHAHSIHFRSSWGNSDTLIDYDRTASHQEMQLVRMRMECISWWLSMYIFQITSRCELIVSMTAIVSPQSSGLWFGLKRLIGGNGVTWRCELVFSTTSTFFDVIDLLVQAVAGYESHATGL
jgi:hypothetical protein